VSLPQAVWIILSITPKLENPLNIMSRTMKSTFQALSRKGLGFRAGRQAAGVTALLMLLAPHGSLRAATSTWNGGSSSVNNWSDKANWGGTAIASGNSVTFGGTVRQTNTNDISGLSLGAVTLSTANWSIKGDPVTLSGSVTFTASVTGTSTWGLDTANPTKLTVTQSGTGDILILAGVISGAGGLMKTGGGSGQGTVYLSNTNNSFTGAVTLYSGPVYIYSLAPGGQISSLGAGTSAIQLGQAGANYPPTLTYLGTNNGATDRGLVFGNFTTGTIAINNSSPNNSSLTFNGTVSFLDDGTVGDVYTVAVGGSSTATNTFTGTWNGSATQPFPANLQVNGPGTWVFNNSIGLIGSLTMSANSHVALGFNGSPSPLSFSTMKLNSGGTLDLSAFDQNSSVFTLGANSGDPQTLIAGHTNTPATDIYGSLSLSGNGPGTLNIAGQGVPATLTISSNFIPAAGIIAFDLGTNTTAGLGSNDLIVVGGNLDLSQGPTTASIFPMNGTLKTNVPYTLIQYSGSLNGDASGITVQAPGRTYSATVSTAVPGVVTVTFSSSGATGASLVWQGNNSADWDMDITQNWLNGGVADYFYNGDNVIFNDNATQFNVNLAGSLIANTVTVSNGVNNYSFSSSSGGAINTLLAGSLTKQGSGQLMISTANSYSGNTVISAGTVLAANNTALGSSTIVLGDSNSGTNSESLLVTNGATTVANPITVSSSGTGTATIGYADGTTGSININGLIALQRGLTIYSANPITASSIIMGGGISGTGDVTVTGGGSVKWQAPSFSYSGNLYLAGSGTYLGVNTTLSTNTSLTVASGAIFGDVSSPSVDALNGGGVIQPGYGAAANSTLTIGSANGSGAFSGYFNTNSGGVYTSLVKNGTGTEIFTGDNSRSPALTTINNGVLAINNPTGSGLCSGAVTVAANGTLAGTGSVYSAANKVSVNGVLSVGNAGDSAGAAFTLTNTGGLFINSGGALRVDLFSGAGVGDNTANAAAADVLNAQCPVTLNANSSLNVSNVNHLTAWAIGDKWKIANWNSTPANTFGVLNLPALPPSMLWDTTNLYTSGVLGITANVPASPTQPATITGVTVSGSDLIFSGTNNNVPSTSFHYAVLFSTNMASPLTNWTALATNPFSANGTFTYTNAIDPATPAMFFDVKAVP
jgi:autotransporter-associated beta strand protein